MPILPLLMQKKRMLLSKAPFCKPKYSVSCLLNLILIVSTNLVLRSIVISSIIKCISVLTSSTLLFSRIGLINFNIGLNKAQYLLLGYPPHCVSIHHTYECPCKICNILYHNKFFRNKESVNGIYKLPDNI